MSSEAIIANIKRVQEEHEEAYKNLATIQKIEALDPIEGADRIEKATVLGWHAVVRKGEFKVGDSCVYIQIDTIVPATEPFAFLGEYRRLKTKKLKGCISQGLVMPFSSFPDEEKNWSLEFGVLGSDITEILNIKKYEKQISASMQGLIRSTRPSYVPKTDEERIQNCIRVLTELYHQKVYISIKLNGTSASYVNHDNDFHAISRNMDMKRPEEGVEGPKKNVYWNMAKKYDLETKLNEHQDIILQGEICGPDICGNMLELKEPRFFVFNVIDAKTRRYFNIDEMLQVVKDLKLEHVPIIFKGQTLDEILEARPSIDNILQLAEGIYDGTNNPREGIVIRPVIEMESQTLHGRLSLKAVSNSYLLKVGE